MEEINSKENMAVDVVKKLVSVFKGASADMRLAYDDAKRKELIAMVPMFNMSYSSLASMMKSHMEAIPPHILQQPGIMQAASLFSKASDCLDTLDSVEVKNLPGVSAVITFQNVQPFKILGEFMQDAGVMSLITPGSNEN